MSTRRPFAASVEADGRPRLCNVVLINEGGARMVDRLRTLRDTHGWTVACLAGVPDGSLHARLRQAGVPSAVMPVDAAMLPSPWRLISEVLTLARWFRQQRFDVVETSLWGSMLRGRLAAWLADVPVRSTFVVGPFHLDAPASRWIDASTWWMESRIVAACECIRDAYTSFGAAASRLAVIRTGVDETRFAPSAAAARDLRAEYGWPPETPLIGHVAWFYPRLDASRWVPDTCHGLAAKGHDDLIRAMPHVLRRFPNARLLLIGDGWNESGMQYRREMQQLVTQHDLDAHVIFTGRQDDVATLYPAIDVAVHPSITEACGGVPESLLLERPTVATRVGGMPDLVIDGKTGVLVNPSDPIDLARGICDLLADPERARALGRAGRAHALQISTLSRSAADLDRLYRSALKELSGGARRGYRLWKSLLRLPVVVALVGWVAWRAYVLDMYFLPKWKAGWRPWRPMSLIVLPIQIVVTSILALAPRSWTMPLRQWRRKRQRPSSP